MKVLHATASTQGQRTDDFCFCTEGELVVVPAMTCTGERAGDPCGCARALAGAASQSGTTTAVVAEVDMAHTEWREAVAAAYVASGWFSSVEEVDQFLLNENELLRAAAAELPVGTVVEYRDGTIAVRESPQSC
jgi:hypothetical protein